MEFIPATCPSCGGDLQVPKNAVSSHCAYCGKRVILTLNSRGAAGASVEHLLELARHAASSTNPDEAKRCFTRVLEQDSRNVEAWMGRGFTHGYGRGMADCQRTSIADFQKALEFTAPSDRESLLASITTRLCDEHPAERPQIAIVDGLEFPAMPNGWAAGVILALDPAHKSARVSRILYSDTRNELEDALVSSGGHPAVKEFVLRHLATQFECAQNDAVTRTSLLAFAHSVDPTDTRLQRIESGWTAQAQRRERDKLRDKWFTTILLGIFGVPICGIIGLVIGAILGQWHGAWIGLGAGACIGAGVSALLGHA